MSRSYFRLETKEDKCSGPLEDIEKNPPVLVNLEKGLHMGDEIIFIEHCENLIIKDGKYLCSFSHKKGEECKYKEMEEEKLKEYFNNLKP
jgi:hypothetical protein